MALPQPKYNHVSLNKMLLYTGELMPLIDFYIINGNNFQDTTKFMGTIYDERLNSGIDPAKDNRTLNGIDLKLGKGVPSKFTELEALIVPINIPLLNVLYCLAYAYQIHISYDGVEAIDTLFLNPFFFPFHRAFIMIDGMHDWDSRGNINDTLWNKMKNFLNKKRYYDKEFLHSAIVESSIKPDRDWCNVGGANERKKLVKSLDKWSSIKTSVASDIIEPSASENKIIANVKLPMRKTPIYTDIDNAVANSPVVQQSPNPPNNMYIYGIGKSSQYNENDSEKKVRKSIEGSIETLINKIQRQLKLDGTEGPKLASLKSQLAISKNGRFSEQLGQYIKKLYSNDGLTNIGGYAVSDCAGPSDSQYEKFLQDSNVNVTSIVSGTLDSSSDSSSMLADHAYTILSQLKPNNAYPFATSKISIFLPESSLLDKGIMYDVMQRIVIDLNPQGPIDKFEMRFELWSNQSSLVHCPNIPVRSSSPLYIGYTPGEKCPGVNETIKYIYSLYGINKNIKTTKTCCLFGNPTSAAEIKNDPDEKAFLDKYNNAFLEILKPDGIVTLTTDANGNQEVIDENQKKIMMGCLFRVKTMGDFYRLADTALIQYLTRTRAFLGTCDSYNAINGYASNNLTVLYGTPTINFVSDEVIQLTYVGGEGVKQIGGNTYEQEQEKKNIYNAVELNKKIMHLIGYYKLHIPAKNPIHTKIQEFKEKPYNKYLLQLNITIDESISSICDILNKLLLNPDVDPFLNNIINNNYFDYYSIIFNLIENAVNITRLLYTLALLFDTIQRIIDRFLEQKKEENPIKYLDTYSADYEFLERFLYYFMHNDNGKLLIENLESFIASIENNSINSINNFILFYIPDMPIVKKSDILYSDLGDTLFFLYNVNSGNYQDLFEKACMFYDDAELYDFLQKGNIVQRDIPEVKAITNIPALTVLSINTTDLVLNNIENAAGTIFNYNTTIINTAVSQLFALFKLDGYINLPDDVKYSIDWLNEVTSRLSEIRDYSLFYENKKKIFIIYLTVVEYIENVIENYIAYSEKQQQLAISQTGGTKELVNLSQTSLDQFNSLFDRLNIESISLYINSLSNYISENLIGYLRIKMINELNVYKIDKLIDFLDNGFYIIESSLYYDESNNILHNAYNVYFFYFHKNIIEYENESIIVDANFVKTYQAIIEHFQHNFQIRETPRVIDNELTIDELIEIVYELNYIDNVKDPKESYIDKIIVSIDKYKVDNNVLTRYQSSIVPGTVHEKTVHNKPFHKETLHKETLRKETVHKPDKTIDKKHSSNKHHHSKTSGSKNPSKKLLKLLLREIEEEGQEGPEATAGGKRLRTRKYITKKKKRTRKLNKRLKKRLTKHKKRRVKKYTRRR